MTQDLKYLGECNIPVRWCDMDAYGHVNNASYFDYFSEARILVLKQIMAAEHNILFMLVDTRCNFKKEIIYPATLKFKHYLKEIGRTSFSLVVDIYSEDEKTYHAQGEAKLVCFDPDRRKAIRIPDFLLEQFRA
jgi:acyl-CoA thioester hydrolase